MTLGIKEKAVLGALGPAMNMIEGWTKDIKPENDVAAFIEANLGILFESQYQQVNPTIGLLTKLAVAEANDNPEFALNKMLRFYEALRVWYSEFLAKKAEGQKDAKS